MGQISIPMSNKVGYSMFWGSMWDNKVNYSRSLKEDIYLNKFVDLILNDRISVNFFNSKKINVNSLHSYNIYTVDIKTKKFSDFLKNKNKIHYYSSKVWVLKYQKWFILYYFIYSPKFNFLKQFKFKKKFYNKYDQNLFYIYNIYKKSNFNFLISFKYFNSQKLKGSF